MPLLVLVRSIWANIYLRYAIHETEPFVDKFDFHS